MIEIDQDKLKFPVCVFPDGIQDYIRASQEVSLFSPSYTSSLILFACSVAIGKARYVSLKEGMDVRPILFLALIGEPGVAKTHVIKSVLKPLYQFNDALIRNSKKERREYKLEHQGSDIDNDDLPVIQQLIVSDTTVEALTAIHEQNPRRMCLIADELASWVGSFCRYKSSSDVSFWNSVYSGTDIIYNRKSTHEAISIRNPYICLVGGIQPDVFVKLFSGDYKDNGLLYRILQARIPYSDDSRRPWNDKDFPKCFEEYWSNIWNRLVEECDSELDECESGVMYTFSSEARDSIILWQNDWEDTLKERGSEEEIGVFRKIQTAVLPISLLLHSISVVCGDIQPSLEISHRTATYAQLVCDYFFYNALITLADINNPANGRIPENHRSLLMALGNRFTTKEAIQIGDTFSMKQTTVYDFLRKYKGVYFKQISHGIYEKNI